MTIRSRSSIEPAVRDTSLWADFALPPDTSAEIRDKAYRNRQIVERYFRGDAVNVLCEEFDIFRSEIIKLRDRCLTAHPDGRIWGFRACVPQVRVNAYCRKKGFGSRARARGGYAGLMGQLMARFPEIAGAVSAAYLRLVPHCSESRIRIGDLHAKFIKLCRKAGIGRTEYPFNTKRWGDRALAGWLDREVYAPSFGAAVNARSGEQAAGQLRTGTGHPRPDPIMVALFRVIMDAHKIDGIWTIRIPHRNGGYFVVTLPRIWIITLIDVATRAILGYYLTLSEECSADDVLKACRNALVPAPVRQLKNPRLHYDPAGGMPMQTFPQLSYAGWSEVLIDNSLAHLSPFVRQKLRTTVGASVNFGPAGMPERRAIKERFYGLLEEGGFHRLPNTTGNSPQDPRRRDAEAAARRYELSWDDLQDLAAVLIWNHHGMPTHGLGHRTPMEQLRYCLEEARHVIRNLDQAEFAKLDLLQMQVQVVVRGDLAKGRRPYINFEGERYSNPVLADSAGLIGKKLTLVVDRDELRTVRAFLEDGSSIGILKALGPWANIPHDLWVRKFTNRRVGRRVIANATMSDPVSELLDGLADRAVESKQAAKQLAKVAATTGSKPRPPARKSDSAPAVVAKPLPPPPKFLFSAAVVSRKSLVL